MFAILVSEKGGEQRRLEFDKPEVTIGRVQGNDIILPKGNVSKRHSRIVLKDGKFIIVDLKSTNGTYVNGRKISSPLVVKSSDKIYIGDFILSIEENAASAGLGEEAARQTMPPPPPPRRTSQPTETVPVDNQGDDAPLSARDRDRDDEDQQELRGPRSTQPSPMAGGPSGGYERQPSPSQPSFPPPQAPLQPPQPQASPQQPTLGMPPVAPPPAAPPPRLSQPTPVVPVPRLTPPPEPPRAPMAQRPTANMQAQSAPPAPPPVAPQAPSNARTMMPTPAPQQMTPLPAPPTPNMPMSSVAPGPHGRLTTPRAVERTMSQSSADIVRATVERLLQRLGDVEANLGRRDPALWMKAEAIATEILETWPGGLPAGVDVDQCSRDVVAEAVGTGPLDEMLADETVDRLAVPRGERIFVERNGVQTVNGRSFSGPGSTERAARRLLARAGKSLPERGVVDALVDGIWITVARLGGGVALEARRPRVPSSLAQLVEEGGLSAEAAELLEGAVRARRNVLVVAPSRGLRDPLIGALCRACEGDRGAIFDAAASATFGGLGWATFDVGPATVRADLGDAMRLSWDRLVVPEIFGPESVDLANFLVAGHDGAIVGFAASSAEEAAVRWGELAQLHSSQTSSHALRSALGRGLHVTVEIGRGATGRPGLLSISEVIGRDGPWELRPVFEGSRPGALVATGYRPSWSDANMRA